MRDADFINKLPPKFKQNINGLHGAEGQLWLENLPQIIDAITKKWFLRIEKVFPNLSFNFVAQCTNQNGEKYVLKIGVPEQDSALLKEHRALEAFDGKGSVKVLRFDEEICAMLLECAVPGKTLYEVCGEDYEKAIEIAVNVMKKLPRRPQNINEFTQLDNWIEGLSKAIKANFELEKTKHAQNIFAELTEPSGKKILLHGDIHFDNILAAQREPFLAIDPKGVVGEIGFEIAVFMNDLAAWTSHLPNRTKFLEAAFGKFSKAFSVSKLDLRRWAFAFAVLSAWWMMEDFGEIQEKDILRAEIWNV